MGSAGHVLSDAQSASPTPAWLSEESGLRSLSKGPFSCDLMKNIDCDIEEEFAIVCMDLNSPASAGVCV